MKTASSRILAVVIIAFIVISALMYLNDRIAAASPGGVDFLTHWIGTRALFQGESPYSNEVAIRVQESVYGRPAQPGENEFLDPYLLHMEVIFAPFALISDYMWARAAWMTFLELASIAIFIISMRIVDWHPKAATFSLYLVYGILGYHSLRPVMNGNVTTAITLILVGAVWAIQNRRDRVAAVLVAFALAKPNLAILPTLLLIVWMSSMRRWRFVTWLAASFVILVLGGMLIVPNWPAQNLANILRYTGYNPPTTLAAALNYFFPGGGFWIGLGAYAILVVLLVRECMKSLGRDFSVFLPVFCLTLVVSQWLWISTDPGNFILLTLPLALVLKSLDELPNGQLLGPVLLSALLTGLWTLFLTTFDRLHSNLQSPIMFFPLPAMLLAGLYLRQRQPAGEAGLPVHVDSR